MINCAGILTNLYNTFDCIWYNLLLKLNAYGLNKKPLKFIFNYFHGRSRKTKVSSSFSIEIVIKMFRDSYVHPLCHL